MIDIEHIRNELVSLHEQCLKKQEHYRLHREIIDQVQLLNDLEWAVKEEEKKLRIASATATQMASRIRKEMSE